MTPKVPLIEDVTSDTAVEFSFPLSATQARCWFLDQLRPGDASLNVAVTWELRGCVPQEHIQRAFEAVIARHEVLRSRLVGRDGTPVQEVLASIDFRLATLDLSHHSEEERVRRLEIAALEFGALPFDLAQPPLLRVKLVRLADDLAMLLIVAHQSVFDGYSIGVLGSEFGIILDAIGKDCEPVLPELPLQYGDYALWQAEYLASEAVREDTEFWKAHLANMRYFEVPPDLPRPSVRSTDGEHVHADLPVSFGQRLDEAAKANEMSSFALGTAVLSTALHRLTGAKEVVIGTQIAGRNEVELESLIGVFINNLVLRLPTRPETRLRDHFNSTSTVIKDALQHQNMPFNRLVAALRPTRDLSRNPIVSINFNLHRGTFLKNKKYDGFELISRPSQAAGVIYDFNVLLIGRPDGWRLAIEYSAELFSRETATLLVDNILACFEEAFECPDNLLKGEPAARGSQVRVLALRAPVGEPESPKVDAAASVTELPNRKPKAIAASGDGSSDIRAVDSGDDVRNSLTTIWSELLDLPAEQCNDDFFGLGGHSLLAMRMLARVESDLGVNPGIGAFLAAPTLDAFTTQVLTALRKARAKDVKAGQEPDATWELIELRGAEPGAPVIVTVNHPIFYYLLAGSFSPGLAIANLFIPDDASIAAQRRLGFEEICSSAVRVIEEKYAGRRVALLGLCVNGRVALGVAQQLNALGVDVAGVGLIDTWAPGSFKSQSWGAAMLRKWAVRQRRWQHYGKSWLKGQMSTVDFIGKNKIGDKLLRRLQLKEAEVADVRLLADVTDHLIDRSKSYEFSAYNGEVILFKTDASAPSDSEVMFGWGKILNEDTSVFATNGWHEDVLSGWDSGKIARILEKRILADHAASRQAARRTLHAKPAAGGASPAA